MILYLLSEKDEKYSSLASQLAFGDEREKVSQKKGIVKRSFSSLLGSSIFIEDNRLKVFFVNFLQKKMLNV